MADDIASDTADNRADNTAAKTAVDLTDDQLEAQLCCLAAQIAVGEAEFLRLVAELDRRELWGLWGLRSAAHWLSWRLGMSLGAAREHVRVAHALEQLPAISAAFAEGQLTYCKVRALTRVATPVSEAELLEIALGTTGAQLERLVRAWRKALTAEESASSQLRREFRRSTEHDGSVVYTLRVAADDAPVMDAALDQAARVVLGDDGQPIETPEETKLAAEVSTEPPRVRAMADAFLLLAESFVATGPVGERGDGIEVVLHVDLDTLLAEEAAKAKPVDGETDGEPDGEEGTHVARTTSRAAVTSPSGQPLLTATALRRMCESSVVVMLRDPQKRPLDLGRRVRDASRKQRRALHERAGGCCEHPGCTQRRRLIPHHVDWWSRGGPTDLDNLVLYCPSHHRGVHEVGYQVVALGGGRFAFFCPDGRPIESSPSLGTVDDGSSNDGSSSDGADRSPHERADEPWQTPVPVWGGEHLDLRLLIDAMVANTVNDSGRLLPQVPVEDIPGVLREAVGWPLTEGAADGVAA
jgi:hypothetical protein